LQEQLWQSERHEVDLGRPLILIFIDAGGELSLYGAVIKFEGKEEWCLFVNREEELYLIDCSGSRED
jgi:hypothetical protein